MNAKRVATILGTAVVASGIASLTAAFGVRIGRIALPEAVGLTGPDVLAFTGGLLVLAGIYAAWRGRKAARTASRGGDADPYWLFEGRRLVVALVAGTVAVVAVALLAKTVIEGTTETTYTIHWIETVPLLALGFGWTIHGEWGRRRRERGAEEE